MGFVQITREYGNRNCKFIKLHNHILLTCQVTPLTALKFAELSAKAGFPKGVINILPGSGTALD